MADIDPGTRHIPAPEQTNWYSEDPHLGWLVRRSVGEAIWPTAEAALLEAGSLVPSRIEPLARMADRHPPVLHPYDAIGRRVDEIEFHPAYTELENTILGFGVVHAPHTAGWRGLDRPAPRSLVTGLLYLFLQADQAITGCPLGMMDAMARCLTHNDPALAERFVPRLADDSGHHMRGAMFLTEKAGGSDVGANETRAALGDDGVWRLHGEKWFASCPHSDLVLVMARPEGAPPGARGLGLFLMPQRLEDGTRNHLTIHRLKEKFGTRAMASGEVGLDGAHAWPVGDLGHGLRQMMDMVQLTRIGIAATTAGAMRRNTHEALSHTARRITFGVPLDHHPLMRDTLAELVVDHTAALTAAIGLSDLLDAADGGDTEAGGALRLLTPLCKGYLTERARICATEAMEVRGGNGFIEDWPDARILRDVYVHAIWEGSSNVIALDVLRALAHGSGPGFLADVERRAEGAGDGPAAALATASLSQLTQLQGDLEPLASLTPDAAQLRLRRLSRRMSVLAIGVRLVEQANEQARESGNGRLAWIAARFLARMGGEPAVAAVADDQAWLAAAPELLHGGHVPLELGQRAAGLCADALRQSAALRA